MVIIIRILGNLKLLYNQVEAWVYQDLATYLFILELIKSILSLWDKYNK